MAENSAKNILLVDDDKFLLQMYGAKFTQAGYTVESCVSVRQALELLKSGYVADVILFDLTMPEQDGYAFLKELSQASLAKSAIKIALTNQSDPKDEAKAKELGADHFIVKASMIPSEVLKAVQDALSKK